MVKVIDAIQSAIAAHRYFIALEFFVPVTTAGTQNLYGRMERMSQLQPLFCSVAFDGRSETTESAIGIAGTAKSILGLEMQVNLTGYTSTPEEVKAKLDALRMEHIQNLLVLRGKAEGTASDGRVHFPHAVDLVRFIRTHYGDTFGIAVAGYPEGHEECSDPQESLRHLKAKVDAGADLIITHMIFDANVFLKFCEDCHAVGIHCPILPGIMPIQSYAQFRNWSRRKPAGSEELEAKFAPVKNNDGDVKRIGVEASQKLIKTLLRRGVRGVYFFTMNMESVILQILEGMDLIESRPREKPWKVAVDEDRRRKETARPIHWASRASSYLARTRNWDEFPNGRWGDTQSPAFGEDTTYHTQLLLQTRARRCPQFTSAVSIADFCNVFLSFLAGTTGTVLPWADELSAEAQLLMDHVLLPLNARGLFTINSQPAVHSVPSTNSVVGWGPKGGYVYQKAYLEMFCSPELAPIVLSVFEKYPTLTYIAMNAQGESVVTNWPQRSSHPPSQGAGGGGEEEEDEAVTVVTWGVFPRRAILQPTIVSLESFSQWAPEAFGLWESPFVYSGVEVPEVVSTIRSTWLLFNVVDSEFTKCDIPLEKAIEELCAKISPHVPYTTTHSTQESRAALQSVGSCTTTVGGGPRSRRTLSVDDMSELMFHRK